MPEEKKNSRLYENLQSIIDEKRKSYSTSQDRNDFHIYCEALVLAVDMQRGPASRIIDRKTYGRLKRMKKETLINYLMKSTRTSVEE